MTNSRTNLLQDISTHPSEVNHNNNNTINTNNNNNNNNNNTSKQLHSHHNPPIDIPLEDFNNTIITTATTATTTTTSTTSPLMELNHQDEITIPSIQQQQTIIIHHHYHHYDKKQEQDPIKTTPTNQSSGGGGGGGYNSGGGGYPPLYLTPTMVMDKMKIEGIRKSKLTFDQMIILSLFAGIFKGVGCTMSLLTAGNSELLEKEIPGLQKFFFGAVFPISLILITMTGSELFTGNVLVVLVGLFSRKWRAKKFFIHLSQFLKNIILSYIFNLIGAFLMAYLFVYLTQPCCESHWIEYVKHVAELKTSRTFGACLLLGIICNMLVTMATYNALAATTLEGKILGIWFPIMVFVSCSFEHSVANAYFIPLGMLYGANVTMNDFIVKNLIPATLGNIIGGAFIIGCLFYYVNDYRNRHNRFIFNFIEKIWKYLKSSPLLSNTRFGINNDDNINNTNDEYDDEEEEDLKSDLDFLEVKNKQQDII